MTRSVIARHSQLGPRATDLCGYCGRSKLPPRPASPGIPSRNSCPAETLRTFCPPGWRGEQLLIDGGQGRALEIAASTAERAAHAESCVLTADGFLCGNPFPRADERATDMTTALPSTHTLRPMPLHNTSFIPIAGNCGQLRLGTIPTLQLPAPKCSSSSRATLAHFDFRCVGFRLSTSDVRIFSGKVTLL